MKKKNVNTKFESLLSDACAGLIYVSETDAGVVPIISKEVQRNTDAEYALALGLADGEEVRSISPDQFFDRLTATKDWGGKRERDQAGKWTRLKNVLETNLSWLKVLKVGDVRIDIYIVGISKSGEIAGVKTKAVET